jgi:hypothetical protein
MVYDSIVIAPFPQALVEVFERDGSALVSGTTGPDGKVTLNAPTKGNALYVLVRMTAPADAGVPYAVTRFDTERAFQGNLLGLRVFQTAKLQALAVTAGKTWDPAMASVQVSLEGCPADYKVAIVPIAGATITIEPGSKVVYMTDGITFDASASVTTAYGRGMDFAVPAGPVTVTVSKNGASHSYSTQVVAGQNFLRIFAPF